MLSTMDWLVFKRELGAVTGLDRDALHVYAAVAIQSGAALVLRRKLGDWLPWLAVAAIALLNEGADIYSDVWPERALQASKTIHDLVNTMIMPTALMIISRVRPAFIGRS